MRWALSWRADPAAKALADRHYNRQTPDSDQFVPPGRCLVLLATSGPALWVTSWQAHVQHAWPGAWVCSAFRNEGAGLSSELILEAVAATRWRWAHEEVPEQGMVTFVDERSVRPKRDPGYCFICAGFEPVGRTRERDYLALRLPPELMPEPEPPVGATLGLAV